MNIHKKLDSLISEIVPDSIVCKYLLGLDQDGKDGIEFCLMDREDSRVRFKFIYSGNMIPVDEYLKERVDFVIRYKKTLDVNPLPE